MAYAHHMMTDAYHHLSVAVFVAQIAWIVGKGWCRNCCGGTWLP